MKTEDVKSILRRCGVSVFQDDGEGQLYIPCPFAKWTHKRGTDNKPSMGVKCDAETTYFNCFSCGQTGLLWEIPFRIGKFTKDGSLKEWALEVKESDQPNLLDSLVSATDWIDNEPDVSPDKITFLPDKILDNWPIAEKVNHCRAYLRSRKVSEEQSLFWDLRFDPKNDRVVLPVRSLCNRLQGAVGRNLANVKGKASYYNYFGYKTGDSIGGAHKFDPSLHRLILVEGFFCLIAGFEKAKKRGCNLGCCFGSKITPRQQEILLRHDWSTQVWFDNDDAGNQGWKKAIEKDHLDQKLSMIRRAELPLLTDVGTMTEDEFGRVYDTTCQTL